MNRAGLQWLLEKFPVVMIVGLLFVVGCADVAQQSRPRTLRGALLSTQPAAGPRVVVTNSLPEFWQYDQARCDEIMKRWYDLLDNLPADSFTNGSVKVVFACTIMGW